MINFISLEPPTAASGLPEESAPITNVREGMVSR